MPNLSDNRFTSEKCFRFSKAKELRIDKDLFNQVNNFCEKNNFLTSKNKYKYEEKKEDLDYKQLIKPVIKSSQAAYLKNINDYSIKENYNLDESRFFTVSNPPRNKNNYDIVAHTKNNFRPVDVQINKWPKYYEK